MSLEFRYFGGFKWRGSYLQSFFSIREMNFNHWSYFVLNAFKWSCLSYRPTTCTALLAYSIEILTSTHKIKGFQLWYIICAFRGCNLALCLTRLYRQCVVILAIKKSFLPCQYWIWTAGSHFPAGAENVVFAAASRLDLEPTQTPILWVPQGEINHSPTSGVKAKNAWKCKFTSTDPFCSWGGA